MATAKQLAWRKKFAAMARAGTLKKLKARTRPARAKNPAPKRRVAIQAKARVALLKPARRRNPLPAPKKETLYGVRVAGTKNVVAYGVTEAAAKRVAQAMADIHRKPHEIVRVTR